MHGMSKGDLPFQEIFTAGQQTDSLGRVKVWTESDLDQVVSNFDANDLAPMVIGHPKHNSPAFGWVKALKRDGKRLLAQLDPTEKFTAWAKAGHIRNRSVSLVNAAKGYKLGHVGFLGAVPPAVEGMPVLEFSADAAETYEFGMSDSYWLSQIARGMRRMRDFFIAEFGLEKADRVTPAFDIEDIERRANELNTETNTAPAFAGATPEIDVEKKFTQADIDTALEAERTKSAADLKAAQADTAQLQFNARLSENRTFVNSLVTNEKGEVRLTPAQSEGLPECLAFLQGLEADSATFTFTAADKTEKKPSAFEFLKAKLTELAPQLRLGREQAVTDPANTSTGDQTSIPSGYTADPAKVDLDRKARAYMAANNTDYLTAVFAVDKSA